MAETATPDDANRSPSPEFSPLAVGEDLSPLPEYKAAATTALDFGGLLPAPLKLHEDLTSGCGGQLWPAGMTLAKHMLRYQRERLRDARILELGAGGGLVGLAVARGCDVKTPLFITDQVEMEELMRHNITLNGLDEQVKARVLNWGEPLSQEIVDFRPDTILAADCVYFEPAFPLLLRTLTDLLAIAPAPAAATSTAPTTVYFCFKKRRRADMQFLKAARKTFDVAEIEDEDRPAFSREGLFLYALTARR